KGAGMRTPRLGISTMSQDFDAILAPPNISATVTNKDGEIDHGRANYIEYARAQSSRLCGRVGVERALRSGPCHAGRRKRHRSGALRHAAQHDEERPHARPERALCATGTGHSPNLRHCHYGPVVGWLILGRADRPATPTDDGQLRALQ